MRTLLVLALMPLAAMAGETSVVKQTYIDDVQFQIEHIIDKRRLGVATDYDDFQLGKLADRLSSLTEAAAPRVAFTPAIDNREPTQQVQTASKDCGEIYLFTEIRGQTGKVVTHVWYANGVEVYSQRFNVKGERWRIWSAKAIREAETITVLVYAGNNLIAVAGLEIE